MHAGGGRKYYLNRGHKFIPLARLYTLRCYPIF